MIKDKERKTLSESQERNERKDTDTEQGNRKISMNLSRSQDTTQQKVKDNKKDSIEFAHVYMRVRKGTSAKTETEIETQKQTQNKDTYTDKDTEQGHRKIYTNLSRSEDTETQRKRHSKCKG